MCGIRVPGLPPIPGGGSDPSLMLSWLYDRYGDGDRAQIRQAMHDRGLTHWLLSWPDSAVFGRSPEDFLSTCRELIRDDFYPCVMLSSKDCPQLYGWHDVPRILSHISTVLPLLIGVVPMFCVGWELSIWLTPHEVQTLIDVLAPIWLTQPGTMGYVHFQEGYFAFQEPGGVTADFWKANVGKLHGVLHQRDLSWDKPMYQARIVDCLQRFAGQFNFPTDSGFGHPFDFVALEITAMNQFNQGMSEAEGNGWGQTAVTTHPVGGPLGVVQVMGGGNGL